MASTMDSVDYVQWFKTYMSAHADLFPESVDEVWVSSMAQVAVQIVKVECPGAQARWRRGKLTEPTLGYVVSCMIARVAMFKLRKTESNGVYQRTDYEPLETPPQFTPSPDLFLKKSEKSLLDGVGNGKSAIGSVPIGLGRVLEVPS
ncbi:hypothetical protein [Bifidobacterium olomucense]|uniref:Uncharacterized protein n=1 Tax=Bifidobacterium olomucense TaxID=2675324 RepID=A0A7Y0EXE5_9BIFI|nr:hypothetical protein [Bifidobacterium sp. DSM 109959]NMM98152.1 hypothetical protein [Bifidobacterium sp. DSM 109959]